jgi:hypothetical protein
MRLVPLLSLGLFALASVRAAGDEDEDDIEVEGGDAPKKPEQPKKQPFAPLQITKGEHLATVTGDEDWKPWAVFFPNDSAESKAMEGVFAELGEKSGDMLSFGIVKTEGKKAKAFAAKEGWKAESADTLIKVYTRPAAGYGTRESSWLPVTAKTDLKELYSALTSKIESGVTLIENSQELSTFVQRHKKGLPKVFLFSKKTEPTALYNAMSAEFEGRLDLSIIGDQDKEILKQFNVQKFPSLMVMGGVTQAGDGQQQISIQAYPGKKFQFKPIKKFLGRFANPMPGDLPTLSSQTQFESMCGVQPCVVLLTNGKDQDEDIKRVAKKAGAGVFKLIKIDTTKSVANAAVADKLGLKAPGAYMVAALQGAGASDASAAEGEPLMILARGMEEDFSAAAVVSFLDSTEELVMETAGNGGKSVAKGLEELDSLPALWGEAKPKPKKRSQKAMLQASATFNMTKNLFNTLVKNSAHVWLVLTCPDGPSACADEVAVWEQLSMSLRGQVWCGTLDSKTEGVVPAGVSLTKAQVYVYGQGRDGSGKSDESQPKLYTGDITLEALSKYALDQLPKNEDGLDSQSFETFVQKQFGSGGTAPTAVVFYDDKEEGATEKDVTPVLRAFGYQYPSMQFGMMLTSEALKVQGFNFEQIIKKSSLPVMLLMFLQPQYGEDGKPLMDEKSKKPQVGLGFQPYQGKWEMPGMSRFLKMHNKVEDGAMVPDDIGIDPSIYVAADVLEITTKRSPAEACEGQRLCAIAMLDSLDSFHAKQIEELEGVALKQAAKSAKGDSYEMVAMTWIDAANQPAYMETFNVASLPAVVVYNPATGDYGQMIGAYGLDNVVKFLDKCTRRTKLALGYNTKSLPDVVEPLPPPTEEEDDFDLSELMGDVMGDEASLDDDDDDDEEGSANPNERGPARFNKKKKKKGKKGKKDKGDKKEKGDKKSEKSGKKKKKAKSEL